MRVESLQSRAISVFIALVLTVLPCLAQTTQGNASLEVIVKDPSGALINKAQVQLVRNGKPQSLSATNQRGEARFNKVPAGRYQIHIEAAGFKAQDIESVELAVGANRREVTLEIDVIKVDVDKAMTGIVILSGVRIHAKTNLANLRFRREFAAAKTVDTHLRARTRELIDRVF